MRVLVTLFCLSAVSGLRRKRASSNTTLVLRGADCDQLSDINVGGHDLGQAAVLLCRFWPAQFGDFPVNHVDNIADLFNQGIDIWEKIKELAKGREGSGFCWKKAQLRQQVGMLLDEHLNFKNATHGLGMASNCDMEIFGRCYGECPQGMKPMAVLGGIVPACTSECNQMKMKTGCGFGCASGFSTCLRTVVDQVGQVTKAVSAVASYMTGNPLIHEVVDKILRLVDFFIDTMFEVVRVAKHVYENWPKREAELGVIIALLQFVLEHAKELGQSFQFLFGEFGEVVNMIMELMDAEFEWKEINLDFIADTLLKHGKDILNGAYEFAEAFVFPTCQLGEKKAGNPDYDCNGDGQNDCGDYHYLGLKCNNQAQCDYKFEFGDFLFDHSCRCRNNID